MATITPITTTALENKVVWGSDNTYSGAAIIESIEWTPIKIDQKIQDGNGFTAVRILGVDGYDVTINCVAKCDAAPPAVDSNINVVLSTKSGASTTKVKVKSLTINHARATEAKWTIRGRSYTDITLS
jgi:hypothetical protein